METIRHQLLMVSGDIPKVKALLTEQKTEILAPAGCYPSLQAAIDAGADAVYFGLGIIRVR